ncbi:MAG: GNAT family N-acetyltransferase [Rubrobacteraceae bacterium]
MGFPTYIAVRSDRHGRGTGVALFQAYEEMARRFGLDRLELVTRPGGAGAGPFFAKLGYEHAGERISRSGERYALYTKSLKEDL